MHHSFLSIIIHGVRGKNRKNICRLKLAWEQMFEVLVSFLSCSINTFEPATIDDEICESFKAASSSSLIISLKFMQNFFVHVSSHIIFAFHATVRCRIHLKKDEFLLELEGEA